MKKIPFMLRDLFKAENAQDILVDEIISVLNDEGVRKLWVVSLMEELTSCNRKVDSLVEQNASPLAFGQLSGRRSGLFFALNQILAAAKNKDLDRRRESGRT